MTLFLHVVECGGGGGGFDWICIREKNKPDVADKSENEKKKRWPFHEFTCWKYIIIWLRFIGYEMSSFVLSEP